MNISKALDLAIKVAESKDAAGGYVSGGKEYETYMTNTEWEAFLNAMPSRTHDEFVAGGGGELEEKNGRPPKMACYGSSSRMIYMLSRDKAGFHFEKKLATTVGGTANIDGFFEDDHRYIFVEAKCHEPYSAKNISVSKSYEKLYRFINDSMAGNVKIDMKISKCGRYLDVEYFSDGERLEHFDLKQLICHLLGIAGGILKGELESKQIDFIYLLYDPTELPLSDKARDAVNAVYERTCYECNLVDVATLLDVIFEFLRQEYYGNTIEDEVIEDVVCKFTFALASQDFYPLLLQ